MKSISRIVCNILQFNLFNQLLICEELLFVCFLKALFSYKNYLIVQWLTLVIIDPDSSQKTEAFSEETEQAPTSSDLAPPPSEKAPPPLVCVIGLHCCGDLTPSLLSLFDRSTQVKAVCCVSCCYHKMKVNDTGRLSVSDTGQLFDVIIQTS